VSSGVGRGRGEARPNVTVSCDGGCVP
jgi:hypothetical protein